MKFLRFLLTCVVLGAALVAVLCASAFVPMVQTWIADGLLARQTYATGTIGSLWVAFGKVEVDDLKLENATGKLTVPTLEASLPVIPALTRQRFQLTRLVAKGWTLDLTHSPELTPGLMPVASAAGKVPEAQVQGPSAREQATEAARSFFHGWAVPAGLSLDGAELEGDVQVRSPGHGGSSHIHVVLSGGGLAQGQTADLAIDVSAPVTDPRVPYVSASAHGHLGVALSAAGAVDRLTFTGSLGAVGAPFPALESTLALDRADGREECRIELTRAGANLASFKLHYVPTTRRLEGLWAIDLRDTDLTPFVLDHPLPAFAVRGTGTFDTDLDFSRVSAAGTLAGRASHLGTLQPSLEQFGTVGFDGALAVVQDGPLLSIRQLSVTLSAPRPLLSAKLVQPFTWDEKSGGLKASDENGDWMKLAVPALPLEDLAGLTGDWHFAGGALTGEFLVRPTKGGFALRPVAPLVARAVSISRAGRLLADHLDISVPLLIDYTPEVTQLAAAPVRISEQGRELGTLDVKTTRTGDADQPVVLTGSWKADLEALAAAPFMRGLPHPGAKSASGELTLTFSQGVQFEGKVAIAGHAANHTFTADLTGGVDPSGKIDFAIPAKIAFGADLSEITAEGSIGRDESGPNFDIKLSGPHAVLSQLKQAVDPLAAAVGLTLPSGFGEVPAAVSNVRDGRPFWGEWTGVLRVDLGRLQFGQAEIKNLGGTLILDATGLRLKSGRAVFDLHSTALLDGELTFAAGAAGPYHLVASSSIDQIEASALFGKVEGGDDPVIEGRFKVERSLRSEGGNLGELIARTHEDFRFTSTVGIVRVLRTNVGDAIPEENTPVADSAKAVGGFVGSIFGAERNRPGAGRNRVGKTADAVLEFVNQISEIGYDHVSVTAIQDPDGRMRLTEISMTAADEVITGTGQIEFAKDLAITERPMSAELKFSGRHRVAELIATGGLPTFGKDAQGFTILSEPIRLQGTLHHVDLSKWHDFLAKAATVKPLEKKKAP